MSAQELEADDRVLEIIHHERAADEAEATADEHRWEAARLISEELAAGTSQRDLATAIGQSQSQVFRKNAVWERFARESDRPAFSKAMNSAAPRGEPKPRPDNKPVPEPRPHDEPEPDTGPVTVITDKVAIAKRLRALLRVLMSQGEAKVTETDESISLVVWKH